MTNRIQTNPVKTKSSLLALLTAVPLVAPLSGAELKRPFEGLPAETVAAFRFDNSPEVRQHYVEQTKIGKLLFSDEKIAEYKAFVQSLVDENEEAAAFVAKLGEVGLGLDDLYAMLSSHLGAAVVMQDVAGFNPMPTLMIWSEMDEEVTARAYQALLDASGENEKIERTDEELAGAPVSRIRDAGTGSSFLVGKLENRFIFAIGLPRESIASPEEAVSFEQAEEEALGYFIQAQRTGEGGFLDAIYSDDGVSASRPDFEPRLEFLGDLRRFLDFLPPESSQTVEALRLKEFTTVAMWAGIQGMTERSLFFVGAPAPRQGIARLMENDMYDFQPPLWAPAAATTYSSFSFDIAKLYSIAIEIAKRASSPEVVDQQIAAANQQLQAMLQTDLDTFLASFGKRFHLLKYPVELVPMTMGDTTAELPQEQQAFIMDFSNPQILDAAIAMFMGVAANNPNATATAVDEQGFKGIRTPSAQGEIVIAHGLGKLIIAQGGETVASRVFSALQNPAEGQEALVNDPEFRAFVEQNAPRRGIAFSYSQGDKILKNLTPLVKTLGDTMRKASGEESGEIFDRLTELFPSEEELEGTLGPLFTRVYFNDAGLIVEGANEYK